MANYVTLSMPRADAELLLELASIGRNVTTPEHRNDPLKDRAIRRLRMAIEGRDLRVENSHNTHGQERLKQARRKWS